MLGSIVNDAVPLLVGGVNICDNQHQILAKNLGFEVLIQWYVKRPKMIL